MRYSLHSANRLSALDGSITPLTTATPVRLITSMVSWGTDFVEMSLNWTMGMIFINVSVHPAPQSDTVLVLVQEICRLGDTCTHLFPLRRHLLGALFEDLYQIVPRFL